MQNYKKFLLITCLLGCFSKVVAITLENFVQINGHAGKIDNLLTGNILSLSVSSLDDINNLSDYITHPELITALSLNGNNIRTLPAEVFDKFTNLIQLFLYDNQISSLPAQVFDKLTSLSVLYFYNNKLTHLPTEIFDKMINLTRLFLYNNQLKSLSASIFDKLINLQRLYLYTNQLEVLPARIFDKLVNLQRLNLSDNQLSSLPENILDNLVNLQRFWISANPLVAQFNSADQIIANKGSNDNYSTFISKNEALDILSRNKHMHFPFNTRESGRAYSLYHKYNMVL